MKKTILLLLLTALLSACLLTACNNPEDPENTPDATETDFTPETQAPVGSTEETEAETVAETDPAKAELPDPSKYSFFQVFEAPKGDYRDAVLNYMREMATVEWTPTEEWTTDHAPDTDRSLNLGHRYIVGKTYYGVPYANTGNSLDGFTSLLKDGKFTPNSPYYTELVGNHCSSSMDRAFEQVLDINGFGGILPEWIPEQLMYPEGSGIEAPEGWTHDTTLIADHSGKDKMFAGYAGLGKGDILYYTAPSGGHTRMVAGVNIVKNADGSTNYPRSTVTVIEQTNAWYTEEKNTTWFVDKKYTFSQLFNSGFIPVTLKAYHDESFVSPDAYIALSGENSAEKLKKNVISGTVFSNFSFSYVRVTITDSEGKIMDEWAEYRNVNKKSIGLRSVFFDIKSYPAGTYTFNLRAGIARGGCDIETIQFTID